nr:hypothetical protein [Chenggangzhangella methanolivorans]
MSLTRSNETTASPTRSQVVLAVLPCCSGALEALRDLDRELGLGARRDDVNQRRMQDHEREGARGHGDEHREGALARRPHRDDLAVARKQRERQQRADERSERQRMDEQRRQPQADIFDDAGDAVALVEDVAGVVDEIEDLRDEGEDQRRDDGELEQRQAEIAREPHVSPPPAGRGP